ncbi:MAG: L,D-transpeptidase [Phyllobacterium sp.]
MISQRLLLISISALSLSLSVPQASADTLLEIFGGSKAEKSEAATSKDKANNKKAPAKKADAKSKKEASAQKPSGKVARKKELEKEIARGRRPANDVQLVSTEVAQPRKAKKAYNLDAKYEAQTVAFSGYKPGTIVIDPKNKFLYFVETSSSARRYGIAVGKEGLEFKGTATVQNKREWPRWIPTKDMIERSPAQYGKYKNGMDGGPANPLGARAMYLFQGNKDTYIRIHGTTQPWSIGSSASNGCFRMVNDHVMELYDRVSIGTEVVVL